MVESVVAVVDDSLVVDVVVAAVELVIDPIVCDSAHSHLTNMHETPPILQVW